MIDLDLFKPWTDHLNFGYRQWSDVLGKLQETEMEGGDIPW